MQRGLSYTVGKAMTIVLHCVDIDPIPPQAGSLPSVGRLIQLQAATLLRP